MIHLFLHEINEPTSFEIVENVHQNLLKKGLQTVGNTRQEC